MASQGPFIVGASANHAGGNIDWTTPGVLIADDNSLANITVTAGNFSNYLYGSTLGFSIPSDVAIDGITVEPNDFALDAGTGTPALTITMTKTGEAIAGTAKTATEGFGWIAHGGSTDLWGTTWTPAEINASTFGAFIKVQETGGFNDISYFIDALRITVYYSTVVIPSLFVIRSNLRS